MAHGQMRFVSFRDRPLDPRDCDIALWPDGFDQWLLKPDNRKLYIAFEDEAIRLWRSGRRHWGARQIVETIRCERRQLKDADKTFRINDHGTPGMARFFMARWGKIMPLFELRPTLPSIDAHRAEQIQHAADRETNVIAWDRHQQMALI